MSATGNPRNKVALKPGHSLMDWIRLGNSEDLAGTGGVLREITKEELAKHCTEKDAWICIRGRIYNITRYLDFHPGGSEELMKGAGIDGTNLFNKVHPWVNFESILQKCLIGRLTTTVDDDVFLLPSSSKSANYSSKSTSQTSVDLKADWYQQNNFVALVIYIKKFPKKLQLCNEDVDEIAVIIDEQFFSWSLPQSIIWPPLLTVTETKVEVKFTKEKTQPWPEMPKKLTITNKREDAFWQMHIKQIERVNHNVFFISLSYAKRVLFYVPLGFHVPIKATINGLSVERNYTPACGLLEKLPNDINLLVKSYPDGVFSSWFTSRKVGDSVMVGNPVGNFSIEDVSKSSHIVLIAAGTGITPMTRLIDWALGRRSIVQEVKLIFFNKKETDIIWKSDIEKLVLRNRRFKFQHILSDADTSWKEGRGYVTPQLLQSYIPEFSRDQPTQYYICVCGPIAFTQLADRYLQDLGYSQENYFCF